MEKLPSHDAIRVYQTEAGEALIPRYDMTHAEQFVKSDVFAKLPQLLSSVTVRLVFSWQVAELTEIFKMRRSELFEANLCTCCHAITINWLV